ncbi:MAG: hypothetical protein R2711_13710 [Acidimicrobiales bacterium]
MLPGHRPSASGARRPRASSPAAPRRSSASSGARCARCATCRPRRAPGHRRLRRAAGRRRDPQQSICGGYVALHDALTRLVQSGSLKANPLTTECAAISVGVVGGTPVLDLPYVEDSTAETDMNVVMTGTGGYVEVQGTAEGAPFSRGELEALLGLAEKGIAEIVALQRQVLATPPSPRS